MCAPAVFQLNSLRGGGVTDVIWKITSYCAPRAQFKNEILILYLDNNSKIKLLTSNKFGSNKWLIWRTSSSSSPRAPLIYEINKKPDENGRPGKIQG